GIQKQHKVHATPFEITEDQILKILTGKVVVGHVIHDFRALQYFHPKSLTCDISHIPTPQPEGSHILLPDCPENASMSLKHLTKKLLNRNIQVRKRVYSSVEDAQATM
ncbi:hypothetical protein P7K49_007114, partial [Saguinus oedipus]